MLISKPTLPKIDSYQNEFAETLFPTIMADKPFSDSKGKGIHVDTRYSTAFRNVNVFETMSICSKIQLSNNAVTTLIDTVDIFSKGVPDDPWLNCSRYIRPSFILEEFKPLKPCKSWHEVSLKTNLLYDESHRLFDRVSEIAVRLIEQSNYMPAFVDEYNATGQPVVVIATSPPIARLLTAGRSFIPDQCSIVETLDQRMRELVTVTLKETDQFMGSKFEFGRTLRHGSLTPKGNPYTPHYKHEVITPILGVIRISKTSLDQIVKNIRTPPPA